MMFFVTNAISKIKISKKHIFHCLKIFFLNENKEEKTIFTNPDKNRLVSMAYMIKAVWKIAKSFTEDHFIVDLNIVHFWQNMLYLMLLI